LKRFIYHDLYHHSELLVYKNFKITQINFRFNYLECGKKSEVHYNLSFCQTLYKQTETSNKDRKTKVAVQS
jgi:hypothetical protein